ncbi:WSC domain-containing protein 9 [Elsinoe australis]|uniref:WSC domain-containing protein 9 n=1 Tax=Elsinoe australis TaxID=40998 RepID=A0A4U7ASQ7_9PEZI|nr:WSC domain-containing protein 9 [Elsinoe australis]
MPFIPPDQLATGITIASFASSLIRIFKHGLKYPVNLIHTHGLAVKRINEHVTEDDHVPAFKPSPTLFTAIPVKSEPLDLWRNDTQALNSGSAYGYGIDVWIQPDIFASVLRVAKLAPEEFSRWNPSVGLDCAHWHDWTSYCIVDKAKLERFSATAIKTTTTSTSLPASTTSTTLAPSPTEWRNLGCYIQDAQYPVLEENVSPSIAHDGLTVPECKNACYIRGYEFAGVQGGNLCFCDPFVGGEWTRNHADCNTPCIGDTKSFCGGKNLINAFRAEDNSNSAPSTTPSVSLGTTARPIAGTSTGTAGSATISNSAARVTPTAVSNSGASRRFGFIFF